MYYPKGQTKVIAVRLLLVVNHLAFMRAVVVVTMVLFRSVVIADIAQKQHDHRALIFCPCWCFHQQGILSRRRAISSPCFNFLPMLQTEVE